MQRETDHCCEEISTSISACASSNLTVETPINSFLISPVSNKLDTMAENKLGPCMQCVRFMLFVFNALLWVSHLSYQACRKRKLKRKLEVLRFCSCLQIFVFNQSLV